MNASEIVKGWLVEHGYAGLCNRDEECGCGLDGLFPCETAGEVCEPAHLCTRSAEEACEGCSRDTTEGADRWFCSREEAKDC